MNGKAILLLGTLVTLALPLRAEITWHGFVDSRAGTRLQQDPLQEDSPLAEIRTRVDAEAWVGDANLRLRNDFVLDAVDEDRRHVDLESGEGWNDLREASLSFSLGTMTDVKAGRQILTWGTGDLLFINDLFPKDWKSFFAGREVEYLKAPSDALMISLFPEWASVDVVYTPRFDPDRFLDGSRFSFYPFQASPDQPVAADLPDEVGQDDEVALRVYRTFGAAEWAVYGYDGFWKSPAGVDPDSGKATFPKLRVWGLSRRAPLGSGISHLEAGYYDSRNDGRGDDPTVRNSEARLLAGYEMEVAADTTLGLQAYVEWMQDYSDYRESLPDGMPANDEFRQVSTLRLTRQLLAQTLTASFFIFYSPTDRDGYVRPNLTWKSSDAWAWTAGANLFFGDRNDTFFGQFEDNNNLYAGVRYSF